MRHKIILTVLFISIFSGVHSQPMLWYQEIAAVNVDLDTTSTVLAQIDIDAPASGKVIVRFDGYCIADSGDMIVIGASNYNDWNTNDGNEGLFARSMDDDRMSFSHSRSYGVTAGTISFYAVAQNYVCNDGSGIASIYGMLTVIYFPDGGDAILSSKGIDYGDNLRGATATIDTIQITNNVTGKAVVRFDGICTTDEGDRIYIAASDSPTLNSTGAECVFVETHNAGVCTNDIPFIHTQVYNLNPGTHTFYAIAENLVEMDGAGDGYFYANFTVEFYPDSGEVIVGNAAVSETAGDISAGPVILGMYNLSTPDHGYSLVNFSGVCVADTGDRIILAASDNANWGPNNASVEMEARDTDINSSPFSHTMTYTITNASTDFFAVADNTYETDGTGVVDIHGRLLVLHFPAQLTNVPVVKKELQLQVYPNPFSDKTNFSFTLDRTQKLRVEIFDVTGRLVYTLIDGIVSAGKQSLKWESSNHPNAIYYLKIEGEHVFSNNKIILNK